MLRWHPEYASNRKPMIVNGQKIYYFTAFQNRSWNMQIYKSLMNYFRYMVGVWALPGKILPNRVNNTLRGHLYTYSLPLKYWILHFNGISLMQMHPQYVLFLYDKLHGNILALSGVLYSLVLNIRSIINTKVLTVLNLIQKTSEMQDIAICIMWIFQRSVSSNSESSTSWLIIKKLKVVITFYLIITTLM